MAAAWPVNADRGDKWQQYQLIPSLQEYVLVSQFGRLYCELPD